jgi:predicted glycosyltransferase
MQRIALYSHDAQGLGHLRRNLAIAGAIADAGPSATLLIAGTREAGLFPLPAGTDVLTLPGLRKDPRGGYRSRRLDVGLDDIVELRVEILRSALRAFAPDVLIVDKLPAGVENELLESFDALHEMGTKIVLGLREVLDEPERVRMDFARGRFEEVVRAHYDEIWVYGDPRVYDPVTEYDFPADLAEMVRYTGYVDKTRRAARTPVALAEARRELGLPDGRICLCMAGGGEDGRELMTAFARSRMPQGTTGVLVTGPLMPAEDREVLEQLCAGRDDLVLLPFAQDGDLLIALADDVVSMGGYNTSCEILATGTRALIVPRVHPRREQLIRAERLADLGALDVLHPDDLDADALTRWIAAGPGAPARPAADIDLGGLRRLPRLLAQVQARPDRLARRGGLSVAVA